MARKKSSVEDALIRGLREVAESEQRQKIQEHHKAIAWENERNDQIKQFKKNIRKAKVYVWKE